MLHINPGAAGMSGFHKVRTMVRFAIDNGVFKDLEVIELGRLINLYFYFVTSEFFPFFVTGLGIQAISKPVMNKRILH